MWFINDAGRNILPQLIDRREKWGRRPRRCFVNKVGRGVGAEDRNDRPSAPIGSGSCFVHVTFAPRVFLRLL